MTLFKSLRVRVSQGKQFLPVLREAVPKGFRGLPVIAETPCETDCHACRDACPTGAIALEPVRLDLGRCVFCDECVARCPTSKIAFTESPAMGTRTRAALTVVEGRALDPIATDAAMKRIFGRSLRLRQVSAGGCNACELELNAVSNVNFDLQRFGIEWVASPRHADALVVTGPITTHMVSATRLAWDALSDPRFVVAVGACAISGGLYAAAPAVDRRLLDEIGPTLFVPGCPAHPLTFVRAILDVLGVE